MTLLARKALAEDIVERLRDQCCRLGHDDHGHTNCWLFGRAAAEIERLREENTEPSSAVDGGER